MDCTSVDNSESSTWSYRRQAGLTRDGTYDLLPHFVIDPVNWEPDVGIWRPSPSLGANPGIGVNHTGTTVTFTLNASTFFWPQDTIWLHPNPNELIVVSWLSAISSLVDIEFEVSDMDATGGRADDGVAWFVDLFARWIEWPPKNP